MGAAIRDSMSWCHERHSCMELLEPVSRSSPLLCQHSTDSRTIRGWRDPALELHGKEGSEEGQEQETGQGK